ncbi:ribonuclease Y [Anaerotardibacter muris]|uniref:ribonuclease Y n=1 Tax=Anaerotardibacter muris TaxID=2941505 RepID=UPI002041DF0E|nr:ribonuclease Y [Anaerotardibacter muris]
MSLEIIIGVAAGAIIIGFLIGFLLMKQIQKGRSKAAAKEAQSIVSEAQREAENLRREAMVEAKDEALRVKADLESESRERLKEIRSTENRLNQREQSLDKRSEFMDKREHQISSLQGQLEKKQRDLKESQNEINQRLERIAGLSSEEAKVQLLEGLKEDVVHESATIIRDAEMRTRAEADKKAREILSMAIQRIAADYTSQITVSTIHIPSDDLKGRIIGREGRNIRSFEQITGTNLIIDDTPESVTVSSHDPVRREIASVTMQNLIADGRIHPARIEEMYNKAKKHVYQQIKEAAAQATFDTGIHDLHPELEKTLGRLRYRTSYGQNVLNHSLEVAYLCGIMASELGLDPVPARRAGLLHDLGKAIDHEVEGSHAVIGADLARRYGEDPAIVHAIEAHHNDIEPTSVIDVLVQAADAVSAARPGARKENLESYIKRLEKLEEIANSYDGVEQTHAIQAGREVRVIVTPDKVDEARATVLAHDIAAQIQNETKYPGQVKVVVIRETRAVDFAK